MVYLLSLGNLVLLEGLISVIREEDTKVILLNMHEKVPEADPDMIIFDSFQAASELRRKHPKARLLFMDSGLPDAEIACLVLCHQVSGIIAHNCDSRNFHKALKRVMGGELWLDQTNLKAVQCNGLSLPRDGGVKGLSKREAQLVSLIVEGRKNSDIAQVMCISEPTVKSHISKIYKKLNVKNRAQLASLSSRSSPLSPH